MSASDPLRTLPKPIEFSTSALTTTKQLLRPYRSRVDKFSSARTRINRVAVSRKIEHQHAD
jgi:hypothetical protein